MVKEVFKNRPTIFVPYHNGYKKETASINKTYPMLYVEGRKLLNATIIGYDHGSLIRDPWYEVEYEQETSQLDYEEVLLREHNDSHDRLSREPARLEWEKEVVLAFDQMRAAIGV